MKSEKINRVRIEMIIEALTDYLEQYCEEKGESDDVSYLVNDHFDEFVNWAYDDIIISAGERDILLQGNEWELIETIKVKVVSGFLTQSGRDHPKKENFVLC